MKKKSLTHSQIETAYRTKGTLVLRRCRFILRNSDDEYDMLHETFRGLLKYDITIETDEISLSFVYRTAERCCFDLMGQRKKQKPSMDPSMSTDPLFNAFYEMWPLNSIRRDLTGLPVQGR